MDLIRDKKGNLRLSERDFCMTTLDEEPDKEEIEEIRQLLKEHKNGEIILTGEIPSWAREQKTKQLVTKELLIKLLDDFVILFKEKLEAINGRYNTN